MELPTYRNLIAWDDLKKIFACDHELILSCKFYGLVADNLGFCTLKCQQIGIHFIFECSLQCIKVYECFDNQH